jgi:hypothetical protein
MMTLGAIPWCYPIAASEQEVGAGTEYPIGFTAQELATLYWTGKGMQVKMAASIDETYYFEYASSNIKLTGSGSFQYQKLWEITDPTQLICNPRFLLMNIADYLFRILLHGSNGGNTIFDPFWGVTFAPIEGRFYDDLYYPAIRAYFQNYDSLIIDSYTTASPVTCTVFGKKVPLYGPVPFAIWGGGYLSNFVSASDSLSIEVSLY